MFSPLVMVWLLAVTVSGALATLMVSVLLSVVFPLSVGVKVAVIA